MQDCASEHVLWTNDSLALIIQGRRGLVQEKDCRIAHQSTSYGLMTASLSLSRADVARPGEGLRDCGALKHMLWTNLNDSLALIIQGRRGLAQEKDCGIVH